MLDSGCPTVLDLEAPQWLNPVQMKQIGLVVNHAELDQLAQTYYHQQQLCTLCYSYTHLQAPAIMYKYVYIYMHAHKKSDN